MRKGKRINSKDLINKAASYIIKTRSLKYGYLQEEV